MIDWQAWAGWCDRLAALKSQGFVGGLLKWTIKHLAFWWSYRNHRTIRKLSSKFDNYRTCGDTDPIISAPIWQCTLPLSIFEWNTPLKLQILWCVTDQSRLIAGSRWGVPTAQHNERLDGAWMMLSLRAALKLFPLGTLCDLNYEEFPINSRLMNHMCFRWAPHHRHGKQATVALWLFSLFIELSHLVLENVSGTRPVPYESEAEWLWWTLTVGGTGSALWWSRCTIWQRERLMPACYSAPATSTFVWGGNNEHLEDTGPCGLETSWVQVTHPGGSPA